MKRKTGTPKRSTKPARLVPVSMVIPADQLTSVSLYLSLARAGRRSFLIEGVEGGERSYRYSYVGIDPSETLVIRDGALHIERAGKSETIAGNPYLKAGEYLSALRAEPDASLPPFSGGAVGYLSYECFQYLESKVPVPSARAVPDDARLMVFRTLAALDHVKHRLVLISHYDRETENEADGERRARAELANLRDAILKSPNTEHLPSRELLKVAPLELSDLEPMLGLEGFTAGVRKIKQHILKGDIFQCVVSDQFRLKLPVPAFSVYRSLRRISPTPYLFYFHFGDEELLGASPEMLTRVTGGKVETCPIAGTRPRGATDAEDARHEEHLLASPKERAEHLMLVDLGRNDIGRVSVPGSVNVTSFMKVERFSHVMHLVSLVVGKLGRGRTQWDALSACFPAGTLSGAPKIRAAQIIAEIEPLQRGPYGGAILTYGFNGNLDSCIGIRSLYVRDGQAQFRAGAGVVADSTPAREYDEVLNKTKALRLALAEALA